MRVELRITLKVASNNIIPAGTVFDTQLRPLPEFVLNRIRRKQAVILAATPAELTAYGLPTTLATSHLRPSGVLAPPARGKAERKKVVTEEKPVVETAEEPPPSFNSDEEGTGSPSSLGEAASAADPDLVAALEGEPEKKPKKAKKSTTRKKFIKKEKTE